MRNYPIAKSRGLHVSLESTLSVPTPYSIEPTKIMAQTYPSFEPTTEVVELSDAIDCLNSAAKTLKNFNTHPRDVSLIAVDANALKGLNVMMLRSTRSQTDLGDPDGSGQANSEAQISSEIAGYVRPLVDAIRARTAVAEDIYESLLNHPSPDSARSILVGALKTQATILHGKEVLASPSPEANLRVSIPSRHPQQLEVRIVHLDYENNCIEARLAKLEAPSRIFSAKDPGVKMLSITVRDGSLFFLIAQAAALGVPVSITANFSLGVSSKGFNYSGTLISIKDPTEFARHLQRIANERAIALFE